jgi:hypothetical protein
MFFKVPTNPNLVETPDFSNRPFVAGFELTITGPTTMTFLPGCARSVDKPDTVYYPPINANSPGVITVDVSTVFTTTGLDFNGNPVTGTPVGFGGCFPLPLNQAGLAGNNTVFPLYAIGNDSGKPFTTIIVPTGKDFLPAGYNSFVRIGQVYIDGTTFHIIPSLQTGHYEVRQYELANSVTALSTLTPATSATFVDLTTGNGPIAPGFTSKVLLNVFFNPNAQTDVLTLNPTGLTGGAIILQGSVAGAKSSFLVEMLPGIDATTGHAGIDYAATSASDTVDIEIVGWTDDMGVALR